MSPMDRAEVKMKVKILKKLIEKFTTANPNTSSKVSIKENTAFIEK